MLYGSLSVCGYMNRMVRLMLEIQIILFKIP